MLRKCFSVASFVTFAGVAVVWAGCGDDDSSSTGASTDAGATETVTDSATSTTDTGAPSDGLDGGVTITYGSCAAFTKCGGDVVGNWKVTGGCLDPSTFTEAKASCGGLQESNVRIQAVGTVDFTATEVTRDVTIKLTGNVFIPTDSDACAAARGQSCLILGFGLTQGIGGLKFDNANCTATTGGCDCAVDSTQSQNTTQAYTASADTLTTQDPTQTFDYCVNGSSNTYFETTSSQPLKLYVQIGK